MADALQAPLAGRTIVVTRAREQASELARRLSALGAAVIEIPTIAIVPPRSWEPLDRALHELDTNDWLIVTSQNTARMLGERRDALGLQLPRQPRTVAVGRATAAALEQAGLRVDLVPHSSVAESVAAAICDQVAGQRVLIARAEVARDLLPVALTAAGARVTIVDAYRTLLAEDSAALVETIFGASEQHPIDALTFTSSSTVKNLAALLQSVGADWPHGVRVFSIGPITSRTLRDHGIEPDMQATQHDIEGLVDAVLRGFAERQQD